MIFGPEVLKKVLSGEKTVTRRRGSSYVVGQVLAVQPGRGKKHVAHIRILDVASSRLSVVMAPGEARREGFRSRSDFINYWQGLHGPISYSEFVTRIVFELAPSCPTCRAVLEAQ